MQHLIRVCLQNLNVKTLFAVKLKKSSTAKPFWYDKILMMEGFSQHKWIKTYWRLDLVLNFLSQTCVFFNYSWACACVILKFVSLISDHTSTDQAVVNKTEV